LVSYLRNYVLLLAVADVCQVLETSLIKARSVRQVILKIMVHSINSANSYRPCLTLRIVCMVDVTDSNWTISGRLVPVSFAMNYLDNLVPVFLLLRDLVCFDHDFSLLLCRVVNAEEAGPEENQRQKEAEKSYNKRQHECKGKH